jgi:hypothetical protein
VHPLDQLTDLGRRHAANIRVRVVNGVPVASFKPAKGRAVVVESHRDDTLASVIEHLLWRLQNRGVR